MFPWDNKTGNYKQLIEMLINIYEKRGYRYSVKLHFLYSHINIFQDIIDDSEEHGEKFNQDISPMECHMTRGYLWVFMLSTKITNNFFEFVIFVVNQHNIYMMNNL